MPWSQDIVFKGSPLQLSVEQQFRETAIPLTIVVGVVGHVGEG